VIVGVDTSPESVAALEWALELASGLHCRVIAVHAIGLLEEGGYRERPDLADLIGQAGERVGIAADVQIERILEDGPPADVIVRVAEREGADLLIVGSRGIGKAPRLLGSTSEAVLAHARLPVLVVPAAVDGAGSPR
jgi:nucleotide-binding universal stress UspA family protein